MIRSLGKARFAAAILCLALAIAYLVAHRERSESGYPTKAHAVESKEAINQPRAGTTALTPEIHIPVTERAADNETNDDWGSLFFSTSDYGAFVERAIPRAVAGDGRAAYYISEALAYCGLYIHLARTSKDPWATLQERVANTPYAPSWVLEKQTQQLNQCISLSRDTVFAALPPVEGGYTYKYWRNLALSNRDPVAIAVETNRISLDIKDLRSVDERSSALEQVKSQLREVILSKDKEALFAVGMTFTNGTLGVDVLLKGFALRLAACDLGYECSTKNFLLLGACRSFGTCSESHTYPDDVLYTLGNSRFTTVYNQSKTIQQMLEHNDMEELYKYLGLLPK